MQRLPQSRSSPASPASMSCASSTSWCAGSKGRRSSAMAPTARTSSGASPPWRRRGLHPLRLRPAPDSRPLRRPDRYPPVEPESAVPARRVRRRVQPPEEAGGAPLPEPAHVAARRRGQEAYAADEQVLGAPALGEQVGQAVPAVDGLPLVSPGRPVEACLGGRARALPAGGVRGCDARRAHGRALAGGVKAVALIANVP